MRIIIIMIIWIVIAVVGVIRIMIIMLLITTTMLIISTLNGSMTWVVLHVTDGFINHFYHLYRHASLSSDIDIDMLLLRGAM